jgi:hypothetical protein
MLLDWRWTLLMRCAVQACGMRLLASYRQQQQLYRQQQQVNPQWMPRAT